MIYQLCFPSEEPYDLKMEHPNAALKGLQKHMRMDLKKHFYSHLACGLDGIEEEVMEFAKVNP